MSSFLVLQNFSDQFGLMIFPNHAKSISQIYSVHRSQIFTRDPDILDYLLVLRQTDVFHELTQFFWVPFWYSFNFLSTLYKLIVLSGKNVANEPILEERMQLAL